MSSILQDIFSDYYEEMIYTLHPRQSVIENVDKMLHCGDPSYGGAMFGCPHCGNLKFVPFRCKSRFCPSCGNRYNQERSFHMSCKLVACVHRHCVFTIPEELRVYFLKDRTLLDCLFHSVRDVVLRMFSKMNKTENFTPGIICVLHTFGRDLKCYVTFHYTRHEDNKTITESVPALNFIQRLIIHIPEKHFKMLRYYGIYAKHHKQEKLLRRCISEKKRAFLKSIQDWRNSILLSFGYDPLRCSECGTSMLVLEVYHKKTALFEQYRKAFGFILCRCKSRYNLKFSVA